MAKITQYSRISHHTITGSSSATFSVPASEDFTDGTWTVADLALSEIGVNEDGKTAYIRIGDEVKEFVFDPGLIGPTGPTGAGGSQSLSEVLAIGNTSGPHHIYMDDGYGIWNDNNTAFIRFNNTPGNEIYHKVDDGTASTDIFHTTDSWYVSTSKSGKNNYIYQDGDLIEINSDDNGATNSHMQVEPSQLYLESADGVGILNTIMTITMSGLSINSYDNSYGSTNTIQMNKSFTTIQYSDTNDNWFSGINIDGTAPSTVISTGYNSGNLLGRVTTQPGIVNTYAGNNTASGTYSSVNQNTTSWRVLKVANDVEVADLRVDVDLDGNFRVGVNKTNFGFGTSSTTGFASASAFSLALPDAGDHAWVKVQVKGISSTFSKAYVADMFGGFRNDGSLNLVGTGYSVIEYTDFTDARADYDIVGTDMKVVVYGETSSNITWSVNVTWG